MKYYPWLIAFFLIAGNSCHKKNDFPFGPPPVITAISPDSGHFSTVLSISGNHFDSVSSGNTVLIDTVPATILYASSDSLVVRVPFTQTGHVVVKTAAGTATGPIFTYLTDVLVAGFVSGLTSGSTYTKALYWANGVPVLLPDNETGSVASCIAASGNDVYVGGWEGYGRYQIAEIWKNGVATALSAVPQSANVNALAFSGNDIYAVGFVNNGDNNIAAYWKNGVLTTLTDGTMSANATSIAISGSNTYIAGYLTNAFQTKSQALLWKNGQVTPLTDTTIDARANSVVVSGNDVFVGGYENDMPGYPNFSVAAYWANGTPVLLPLPNTYDEVVNSIALSGYNLFMTGNSVNSYTGSDVSTWSSGPAFAGPPYTEGYGWAIVVDSPDVYVAGQLEDGYNSYKAHYWKNGMDSLLDQWAPAVQSDASGIYIRH